MGSFGQNTFPSFNVMANGSESQSRNIRIRAEINIFSTQRDSITEEIIREKISEMSQESNNEEILKIQSF